MKNVEQEAAFGRDLLLNNRHVVVSLLHKRYIVQLYLDRILLALQVYPELNKKSKKNKKLQKLQNKLLHRLCQINKVKYTKKRIQLILLNCNIRIQVRHFKELCNFN